MISSCASRGRWFWATNLLDYMVARPSGSANGNCQRHACVGPSGCQTASAGRCELQRRNAGVLLRSTWQGNSALCPDVQ